MAPRRVPKTKQNKLTGAASPRSSFLGGGMGSALGGGLALGLGALSLVGLSSTLSNLGPLDEGGKNKTLLSQHEAPTQHDQKAEQQTQA